MSFQITHGKRPLMSTRARDYSCPRRSKGPKVLTLLQIDEKERQLDDRQKKEKHGRFFITFCEHTCTDFIPTGQIASFCQKITEVGMIANKSPSAIDWTIIPNIPNTSILDKYMNIDSQLDKWEDVVEDDVVIDMQDEMTAA
jgi:hypothetical protein